MFIIIAYASLDVSTMEIAVLIFSTLVHNSTLATQVNYKTKSFLPNIICRLW